MGDSHTVSADNPSASCNMWRQDTLSDQLHYDRFTISGVQVRMQASYCERGCPHFITDAHVPT
jgi:hypothetical protein